MGKVIFIFASIISGIVEIGIILYAINQGYSIIKIILIVLAYQISCFFPLNIMLKKCYLLLLGIFSIILLILFFFIASFWFLLLAILFISPCLQIARSIHRSLASTGIKRLFRILGFIISPVFNPMFLLLVSIFTVIVIVFSLKNSNNKIAMEIVPKPFFLMILHQMHYFAYAYIILIVANKFDNNNGFFTALVFTLGWITYISAQYIFRGKYYSAYLACGHIFLALILVVMAISGSDLIKIILWVFSGFGAGTVFCIKEVLKKHGGNSANTLETSENYGHILGLLACIGAYAIFDTITAPIIVASVCAILTVFLVFILSYNKTKEFNYD